MNRQLLSDLNGVFLAELPVDETTETSFEFRVTRHALEGDHLMQVTIAYEDKYGNTFNETGSYRVHVSQPVELEHDPIKLPETLTSGDTFLQIIYVYNPSCATAYNVRGVLDVDGLICSSAYLGNIPPQGSAEKEGNCTFDLYDTAIIMKGVASGCEVQLQDDCRS